MSSSRSCLFFLLKWTLALETWSFASVALVLDLLELKKPNSGTVGKRLMRFLVVAALEVASNVSSVLFA